ncbi:hypothetical protein ACFV3F_37295, partial [Streptomyces sp. NPDC059717]
MDARAGPDRGPRGFWGEWGGVWGTAGPPPGGKG